jgi:hypothetical protein
MEYCIGNTWQMIIASPLINKTGERQLAVVVMGISLLPEAGEVSKG